jgi:2-haloacid dehalogenase
MKPEDILFVAGSSGDVVGAADAGMRVVWNNHAGLAAKPGSKPLTEGRSLDEALKDFL